MRDTIYLSLLLGYVIVREVFAGPAVGLEVNEVELGKAISIIDEVMCAHQQCFTCQSASSPLHSNIVTSLNCRKHCIIQCCADVMYGIFTLVFSNPTAAGPET